MIDPQELHIIHLMKEDARAAIPLIYDRYADSIYGILLSILGDEDDAQEALQRSFIKYWKKAATYDPKKAKLFTWLLNVARNTALDMLRARSRSMQREIRNDLSIVSMKSSLVTNPDTIDVRDQVAKLAEKYQTVLDALFFKGMTQQEASEALDIPLGTVKTRLRYAMTELRNIFGTETLALIALIYLTQ